MTVMKDIDEIRRENIRLIEQELGSAAIAAKSIGMGLAQYLNLREGAKDSKTGIPRGMRKQTAWKIEDGAKKPRGWLDIDHSTVEQNVQPLDLLAQPVFPLRCPECGKVSQKSFIELEMNDRLPCNHCAITFNINDQYGNGQLEAFIKAFGRSGFILRQNRKFD